LEDRFLSIQELCVYLSLKRDSIYRLLKNNDLPGHKVGKSWRFQVSEIDAWIKSGKEKDPHGKSQS